MVSLWLSVIHDIQLVSYINFKTISRS